MKNQEKGKKGDETPWNEVWERSRVKVYAAVNEEFVNMTEHEGRILSLATWEAWKRGVTDATGKMPDQERKERCFKLAAEILLKLIEKSPVSSQYTDPVYRMRITDWAAEMAELILDKTTGKQS